jgi:hypothetical protein
MKKSLFVLFIAACVSLVACGGAHAQTLYAHAQFGPNQTVDLLHAKVVDMTPGAQKVTDVNGVVHSGAFPSDADFINSDFQARYASLASAPYVWYNVTAMTGARCVSNQSILDWNVGGSQSFNDACARFTMINDRARR